MTTEEIFVVHNDRDLVNAIFWEAAEKAYPGDTHDVYAMVWVKLGRFGESGRTTRWYRTFARICIDREVDVKQQERAAVFPSDTCLVMGWFDD